jgi:hypothetical protein
MSDVFLTLFNTLKVDFLSDITEGFLRLYKCLKNSEKHVFLPCFLVFLRKNKQNKVIMLVFKLF